MNPVTVFGVNTGIVKMLPNPKQCVTTPHLHIVVSQPANQTRFVVQETKNAGNLPPVCRVCLAMGVRMYQMSEHELSAMYARITGVVINTEDKLPQQICWECAARLSSANDFTEKALRTHLMLSNKISSDRFLTLSDITSIDRTEHQLQSKLSNKLISNDEKCNFYIIEHSIETDVKKKALSDLNSNNYNEGNGEKEICECQGEIKVEICISDDIINEDTVTREKADAGDEQGNTFNETCSNEKVIIKKEKEDMLVDNECSDVNFSKSSFQDSYSQQSANGTQCPKISEIENRNNSENPLASTGYVTIEIKSISESDNASNVNTTESTDTKYYNCIYCTFKSRRRDVLNKHINRKHTKSTYKLCSYCSYKTHRKGDLIKHINSRHTKSTSYNCSYCSYKAYQRDNLSRHVNSQHTKSTCYYCPHCSYGSYSKAALKKHNNSKHSKS